MTLEHLFVAILLSGLLGFGGLGSLPVLRDQLSALGASANGLILRALAVGNISPGPNGLYLIAIGYFVRGLPGALVSFGAMLIPPMFIFVLDHVRRRLTHLARFRSTLASMTIAVVALLVSSSSSLAVHAATGPAEVAMIAVGFVVLFRGWPPLAAVACALAAGLALS